MKRILLFLMVIVLLISMTFMGIGCKEESQTTEEAAETEAAEDTEEAAETEAAEEIILGEEGLTYWVDKAGIKPSGELTIYSYKPEGASTEEKVARKFVETYPDVTLEWIQIPAADYAQKITMEILSGTQEFDMFWSYGAWTSLFHNYLEDVTDRIPEDLRNDIVPNIVKTTGYEGSWYGAPIFLGTGGIVYNMDILSQQGYDKPPETWDEYFKVAEACTIDENKDGIPEIFGHTGFAGIFGRFLTFDFVLRSVGGQLWNEDDENPQALMNSEEGVRALKVLKTLFMSDFSDPTMLSGSTADTRKSLASGQVAMGIADFDPISMIVEKDFPENIGKLGYSLTPHDPGYESWAGDTSLGFVIREGGNVETALGFVLFYMSPEMQKFVTADYGFPSGRISLSNDKEYIAENPFVPLAIEQGNRALRYIEENEVEIRNSFAPIFDNYFNDKIDEETAVSQMEEIFNEAWKD